MQVVVGHEAEHRHHLVEHPAVLSGDAHNRLEVIRLDLSSFTSGHIFMASEHATKTSIIFFIRYLPRIRLTTETPLGPIRCMTPFLIRVLPVAHDPSKWWMVQVFPVRRISLVSQSFGQK